MNTSSIARADAAFQEQVHAQWRDWRSYLAAHLTLLQAQSAEHQIAFERSDAFEDNVAEAQRRLAALPVGQRAVFDGIREARRQQVQAAAETQGANDSERVRFPDPDAIEQEALAALSAEADGKAEGPDRAAGWGDVPLQIDGAVQWYRVNVQALRDAPGAAAYAAGRPDSDDLRRRIAIAGLLASATVIFLAVWFLWPRGASRPAQADVAGPTRDGVPLTVWPVTAVELAGTAGTHAVASLAATQARVWPEESGPTSGFWRSDAVMPIAICVTPAALSGATHARLPGGGTVPDRDYALSTTRGSRVDLVMESCRADRERSPRYGVLQGAALPPDAVFGETTVLSDGVKLAVQPPQLIGPGADPTLPAEQARVIVEVQSTPLDWAAYQPTLTLASGEELTAPEVVTLPDRAQLRYLVPLPSDALDVAWSLTPPGASRGVRWRATLTPPPTRAEVLQAAIAVRRVTVQAEHGELNLLLDVQNRGAASLQLTRDDLVLEAGGERVALPDLAALQQPLAPGEVRTLQVPLPPQTYSSPHTLTIGAARFEIASS